VSKPNSSEPYNFVLRYISSAPVSLKYISRETALIFTLLTSICFGTRRRFPHLFTCDGQHEGDEKEDEARSGTPGHAGRLHLLSDSGAQGDACNATLASPDSLLADVRPWNLLFLAFSPRHPRDADALHPSTLKRYESTHADSHPVSLLPHPRMLRMSTLLLTHLFCILRNN